MILCSQPHYIDRLLSLDEPLVAGIYPMKKLDFAPVYNELPEMKTDEKGLYILKEIGTGFMMIRRDCIENIIEKGLAKTYKPQRNEKTKEMVETVYHLFPVEVVDDNGFQYLESEDYGFCRLHREAGGEVKGDALCALDHVGRIKYPVMPKRLLEAYEHNKQCIVDDKELN